VGGADPHVAQPTVQGQRQVSVSQLICGPNTLPNVMTANGSGFGITRAAAIARANASANQQARVRSASFTDNYPCPASCSFVTVGYKKLGSPAARTWGFVFFFWASVTFQFQPELTCS
jgi:hypothetical protein